MINVIKSNLPELEEYISYLYKIWESKHLTNNGPLVKELEEKLKEFFGVKYLYFVSNGTIALQIAIKALGLSGEIITTPFSFVATTSTIVWENCQPVFVDIRPDTLCINPELIEKAITSNTTGIIATHVYGHPCDVEQIKEIAERNGLSLIYDAAHAFGVNYKKNSITKYGDISTLSFHATKIYHTVEGGALITSDDQLAESIYHMRNFGIKDREDFWGLGINGKNSELHAAMGLCNLSTIKDIIETHRFITETYDSLLKGTEIIRPCWSEETEYNYSYYPIIFPSEELLLKVRDALHHNDIFPRRYFYPSLNNLPYLKNSEFEVSDSIAKRILCLPLYKDLDLKNIKLICNIIKDAL